MKAETIRISLAGLTVPLRLRSHAAAEYFRDYLLNKKNEKCLGESRGTSIDTRTAFLSDERLSEAVSMAGGREAFAEYSFIIEDVARCIIPYGRSFFHSVAVRYDGGVYLLTGQSGVGKSTQYRNLSFLYGDKVAVLNGDKPVLEFPENGPVIVHSSPWKGKERWGSAGLKAPLRCVVCLEQADENRIERLSACEAVQSLYGQFLYRPETCEEVNRVCDYAEKMIREVPIYRMTNRGDLISSRMLFEQVILPVSEQIFEEKNSQIPCDIDHVSNQMTPEKEAAAWEIKLTESEDSVIIGLRPDVVLRNIAGIPLLVASGDAAAECAALRGLNVSAAALLERLRKPCTEEQLISFAAELFDAKPENMKEDILEFLTELRAGNYLIEKKPAKSGREVL